MPQHKMLLTVGSLCLVAALACTGMTEPKIDAPVDKLRVGKEIKKKGMGQKHASKRDNDNDVIEGEYIVKFRNKEGGAPKIKSGVLSTGDKKLDTVFKKLAPKNAKLAYKTKASDSRAAGRRGMARTVTFSSDKPKSEVIKQLEAQKDVEWVQPMAKVRATSLEPNDPYWSRQWHMERLNVVSAWETSQGEGTIVAVVDTGVTAGEDGYYKLIEGYDFIDFDADAADLHGHGSHVSGTIGQATNNGIGTGGVAPKVTIMPVRVLDQYGSGSAASVANGIIWAADHGANIINMSLGSTMPMDVVGDACDYALEQGVTIFAASGNNGFTDQIGFPAAYDSVIAVGALDHVDTVTSYSNQGPELELIAPGGDTSNDSDNDGFGDGVLQETVQYGEWAYHYFNGTSMACPHAAGVAALVHSNGITDPYDLRIALHESAEDLGSPGWDMTYGHGLVDPVAALAWELPDEDDRLTMLDHSVHMAGELRAIIGWTTSIPANSRVRGDDGFELKEDTMITQHRVTVHGAAGDSIEYKFGGSDGKRKVAETVRVTF